MTLGMGLRLILAVLLAASAALAQEKTPGGQPGGNGTAAGSGGDTVAEATKNGDYVIGAQDVLHVSVWKEPELTATVPVRPDGKISLPLLHDVKAAGLTPIQLADAVSMGLQKYVSEPRVTVVVTEINSKRVFILGEVLRSGALPLLPNMTVLQAISSAGGLSQFASTKNIYIMRHENGKQVKYPFNYRDVLRGQQPDLALKPGDTIVVP